MELTTEELSEIQRVLNATNAMDLSDLAIEIKVIDSNGDTVGTITRSGSDRYTFQMGEDLSASATSP